MASMTLTGYFLGRVIPGIEHNIEYVIAIVIFLSILPLIIKYLQHRRQRRRQENRSGTVAPHGHTDNRVRCSRPSPFCTAGRSRLCAMQQAYRRSLLNFHSPERSALLHMELTLILGISILGLLFAL